MGLVASHYALRRHAALDPPVYATDVRNRTRDNEYDALVLLRTKFTVFVHSGSRYDAYVDVDSDIDNGLQNLHNAPHILLTADDLTARKSRGGSKTPMH